MPDEPRFPANSGTITYKITNQPTLAPMPASQVEAGMALAFSKWSVVSNFVFKPLTGSAQPDINISFGTVTDAANLAETGGPADPQHVRTGPVNMVFDDSHVWTTSMADQTGVWDATGAIGQIKKVVQAANRTEDLVTVGVHEIGHALGLGHSTDSASVMQAGLGIWSKTISFYMSYHMLPDVDAHALAERYAPVTVPGQKPTYPDPSELKGYAIVGSSFVACSDKNSKTMFGDTPYLCWGDRGSADNPPLPLMDGYAQNPMNRLDGYAYLSLHVASLADIQDRKYVVGGGVVVPTGAPVANPIDLAQSDEDPQPSGPSAISGMTTQWTWGQQSGHFQLCGTFDAYNVTTKQDTNCLWYFILQSSTDVGAKAPPGAVAIKKITGDSGFSGPSQYDQFSWGDATRGTQTRIGSARTNGKYNNSNSFAFMYMK